MTPRVCFATTFAHHRIDATMLSVADILRVLPDYRQPTTPEILADFDFNDFNDSSGAATIFVPVDPATPPLLGLIILSTMV